MADGFGGSGYIDPATGEWVSTPGTTLNDIPQPRPITTPNSSSGQPAFADPSATGWDVQFAQPQGGQLTTRTPNSRTGASAPGIRTLPATRGVPMPPGANPATMPGLPLGGALGTGVGALLSAPTTDQGVYNNANAVGSAVDNSALGKWLIAHGITSPSPKWGAAPATAPAAYSPSNLPAPVAAPGVQPQRGAPWPPGPPPPPFGPAPPNQGPKTPLPPFIRGPLPYTMPSHAPASINLGHGPQTPGAGPAAAAPPAAPSPWFTGIDRPNADIVGGPTRPGYLSADPHEPGGPARMGALDLSGLFNHPAVAAQAAAHPAVQGALAAQQGGQWAGTPNMDNAALGQSVLNAGGRSARAPMIQPAAQRSPFSKYRFNGQNPGIEVGGT